VSICSGWKLGLKFGVKKANEILCCNFIVQESRYCTAVVKRRVKLSLVLHLESCCLYE
jgi:hypothetical protein